MIQIASLADAIYVLHAFQKKTQRPAKREMDVAEARFKNVMRSR